MEPLPEHMIEAMTGEQLVIDLAALTGRTVEEVRQDRVQSTLVAPFMSGGAPEGRLDLQRLAQGESFVPPATETARPADWSQLHPASNGTGNTMSTGQPSCAQCFA